ncbi:MAG: mismatch repair protein, partial [Pseudomonadota bacterium]
MAPAGDASSSTELDAETCAALQWPTLLSAIGAFCTSSPGKARALALQPAPNLEAALANNRVVAEMLDLDRLGLAPSARAFPDVSGARERAERGGVASAAELWQVRELLELSAKLRVFARGKRESHPAISQAIDSPSELALLEEDLAHSLDPDGTVADRASPELARARQRVREL